MKSKWDHKLCDIVSRKMNMIQYDLCEKWYHWYIYQAKECIKYTCFVFQ